MARASRTPANAACDRLEALAATKVDRDAARDIKDRGRLCDLRFLGQGLAAWAAQFDPNSYATLLAAGAVGPHGLDAVLGFIDDKLRLLAPYEDSRAGQRPEDSRGDAGDSTTGSARGGGEANPPSSEWLDAQWQLCRTLNTFRFQREHVAGDFRMEPDLAYPYDESPDSVPWYPMWEPADEATAVVAQAWFRQFPDHELLRRGLADAQRVHDKIARHGRDEVRRLIVQMRAVSCDEGFPRVRAAIATLPPGKKKADAENALKGMRRATLALGKLVTKPVPGDPTPFGRPHQEFFAVSLIEKFVDAGRAYNKHCVPLIEKRRGSRQKRRDKVARWFAVVAQYAFLASSNGRFRRFAELVAAVEVFSVRLQEDVTRLLDAISARQRASDEQILNIVQEMNAKVVEPQVVKRWQAALEREGSNKEASFYGKMIKVIVESENRQVTPWERGDVLPALCQAGLITAKGQRKIDSVTNACFLMQHAGLAVQVPFGFFLGDANAPPSRKGQSEPAIAHDGEKWIVNPLGAVLADLRPADASKPAGVQSGKRQPKLKVADVSAPRGGAAKNLEKRKPGGIAKPKQPRPPSKRSLPKAAKKWPRA